MSIEALRRDIYRPGPDRPMSMARPDRGGPVSTRSRGRMAAGVLALAASALLGIVVYGRAADRLPVLVVAREVESGDVVESGDLTLARVSVDAGVQTVPASQRSSVVGKRASTRLVTGSLLTPANLGDGPSIAPGLAVIGAVVRPGQYPAALRAGDAVAVVSADAASPVQALIASVARSEVGGATAVSLAVPASTATRLAIAGAQGQLLIMVPAR